MSYKALYRTYRPTDFTEVSGQSHITTTLQNALKNGKVAHAYLFSGPRGTGKTSIAKILAKAVNCELAPIENPCNTCATCVGIQNGMNSDVIEIDAASNNGVDEIREIRDKVKYLPGYGKYKVYIIDEVHMLSTGAFNALLKTLEEPPSHVIFILCTTEPHKIPLTIHSRCQRFDFKSISTDEIYEKLVEIVSKEDIHCEDEALRQIALFAEGGLRDALSLLDQALSYNPKEIKTEDILHLSGGISYHRQQELAIAIRQMDAAKALKVLDELIVSGKEVSKILQNLIQFYRNMLMYKSIGYTDDMSPLLQNETFEKLAKSHSTKRLFFYIDVLSKALSESKWSANPRLYLEIAFLKMTDDEPMSESKLLQELSRLEERIVELENRPTALISEVVTSVQPITKETTTPHQEIAPSVDESTQTEETQETTQEVTPEEGSLFDLAWMPIVEATKEVIVQDLENTYPISFIEDVLNNGDRNDKAYLQNSWQAIMKQNTKPPFQSLAQTVSTGTVVASSKDKIIITFSSAGVCNRLMRPQTKVQIQTMLANTFRREIEVMCLPDQIFQMISTEFATKWRNKETPPIRLSKIVSEDLRDVSREFDQEQAPQESKVVSEAIRLFGDVVNVKK